MAHECGLDFGAEWGLQMLGHFKYQQKVTGTHLLELMPQVTEEYSHTVFHKMQQFWNGA